MAHYPVGNGNGTVFYSEMNVPGKPVKQDGITYFIYFNIFFSGSCHPPRPFIVQWWKVNDLCA